MATVQIHEASQWVDELNQHINGRVIQNEDDTSVVVRAKSSVVVASGSLGFVRCDECTSDFTFPVVHCCSCIQGVPEKCRNLRQRSAAWRRQATAEALTRCQDLSGIQMTRRHVPDVGDLGMAADQLVDGLGMGERQET
ncbi:hypothetical protein J6590_025090 [Homalodisca vitripennis]|nr:hypothetical protein J6590_025090 [Homalodisca vitripennis]